MSIAMIGLDTAKASFQVHGVPALHTARALLIKQQTMLSNALRSLAAEFGLVAPQGLESSTSRWRSWKRGPRTSPAS